MKLNRIVTIVSTCLLLLPCLHAQKIETGVYLRYGVGEMGKPPLYEDHYWQTGPGRWQIFLDGRWENGTIAAGSLELDASLSAVHQRELRNLLADSGDTWIKVRETWNLLAGSYYLEGQERKQGKVQPLNVQGSLPKGKAMYYRWLGQDLALYLRTQNLPDKSFPMVLVDMQNNPHDFMVKAEGEDVMAGYPCRRYRIEGQGIFAQMGGNHGTIWVAAKSDAPALIRMDLNVRWTWTIGSISIVLKDHRTMPAAEWQSIQEKLAARTP